MRNYTKLLAGSALVAFLMVGCEPVEEPAEEPLPEDTQQEEEGTGDL